MEQKLNTAGATSVQIPEEPTQKQDSVTNDENRGVMNAKVELDSLYALISVLGTLAIAIGQRRSV